MKHVMRETAGASASAAVAEFVQEFWVKRLLVFFLWPPLRALSGCKTPTNVKERTFLFKSFYWESAYSPPLPSPPLLETLVGPRPNIPHTKDLTVQTHLRRQEKESKGKA